MKARKAHFRLSVTLNGAPGGTVTITQLGDVALLEVRPLRRRKVYTATLADVARGVIYDQVKRELRERKIARKLARRVR